MSNLNGEDTHHITADPRRLSGQGLPIPTGTRSPARRLGHKAAGMSEAPTGRSTEAAAPGPRRRRADRRILAVALSISAGVHAAVLSSSLETNPRTRRTGIVHDGSVVAMRVVNLAAVPGDAVRPVVQRNLPAVEASVAAHPSQPAARAVPLPASRAPASAGARLAPRMGDARLWQSGRSFERVPDPLDRNRAYAERAIATYYDSLEAASKQVKRPMTWTSNDASGRSWGASPGTLWLGSIAVPYCGGDYNPANCGFGAAPGRRDEFEDRLRMFNELQRQANRVELERAFDERIRAIRAQSGARRDSTGR